MNKLNTNQNFLSHRDRRFLSATIAAFVLSLILIMALQVSSFLILRKQIEREFASATLVSASGAQETRSQRITLLSLALLDISSHEVRSKTKAAIQQEISGMQKTHIALVAGNPQLSIGAEKSPEVLSIFFEGDHLDDKVRTFLNLASTLSEQDEAQIVATNPVLIQMTELSRDLLLLLKKLTNQYREEGTAGIRALEALAERITYVIACALLGIGLGIFVPITRRLKAEFSERNQVRLELLEQNKELEQFATVVAHDLKAPLNNIRGFNQYLRTRLTNNEDREAIEVIEHMEQGVQRMASMITELLQYARITKREKKRNLIDCNELVRKTLNDFKVEIEQCQCKFTCAPLPRVIGDPLQMEHLFHNLVSNALKYRSPDRTPEVKIYHCHDYDDSIDPSFAAIAVEDNGKGFPPGTENQMFEPFKRLSSDGDGIGFGLSLCKKIARRHGGSIWAEPSLSGGARFIVVLPVQ